MASCRHAAPCHRPAAGLEPGGRLAPAPPSPGRARAARRHAGGGLPDRRAARPGDVVGRADPVGAGRRPRAGRARRRALARPHRGQDLGDAGHAARAPRRRAAALAGWPEHQARLRARRLAARLRRHPGAARRAAGRGRQGPGGQDALARGARRRGRPHHRLGGARRQAAERLGLAAEAGGLPRLPVLRARGRPAGPLHPPGHLAGRMARPGSRGGRAGDGEALHRGRRPRHPRGLRALVGLEARRGRQGPGAARRRDRPGRGRGDRRLDARRARRRDRRGHPGAVGAAAGRL